MRQIDTSRSDVRIRGVRFGTTPSAAPSLTRSKASVFGVEGIGDCGDMLVEGILDPAKVTRSGLQISALVASLLLTTAATRAAWTY